MEFISKTWPRVDFPPVQTIFNVADLTVGGCASESERRLNVSAREFPSCLIRSPEPVAFREFSTDFPHCSIVDDTRMVHAALMNDEKRFCRKLFVSILVQIPGGIRFTRFFDRCAQYCLQRFGSWPCEV